MKAARLSEKVWEAKARTQWARAALRGIGWAFHPFNLLTGQIQTEEVAESLDAMLEMLSAASQGERQKPRAVAALGDLKENQKALVEQMKRQMQRCDEDIAASNFNPQQNEWIKRVLVAWHYLTQARSKLPTKEERQMLEQAVGELEQRAWLEVGTVFETAEQWEQAWGLAAQACAKFQRSTSCVEGRNGVLSLKYHAWHTMPEGKLKALEVMHNYWIERPDGTTAAERFFGQKPQTLWSWMAARFIDLPLPRRRAPPHPPSVHLH